MNWIYNEMNNKCKDCQQLSLDIFLWLAQCLIESTKAWLDNEAIYVYSFYN